MQIAEFIYNFNSRTKEMHQILKFILFCSSTLHDSDSPSVHHQEPKTVHTTAGTCHAGPVADCASKQPQGLMV